MKKILLAFLLLASLESFSQTCEEKETKLLQAVGGFSSALLYNTYGLIGSIADAYAKDVYTAEMVHNLMSAQKKMTGNLVVMLNNLVKDSVLRQPDKDYAMAVTALLNSLQEEAGFLQEYADSNSGKKRKAYEDLHRKNWSAISRLMGIKE
ncbi:MAG: hypothetical protein ABIT05_10245 [Chitinophagaceae bacterium]